jgi:hypothetical protein
MSGAAPDAEVREALHELQLYLSDNVPPLIVADSIRQLLNYPPALMASNIHAWTTSQYRGSNEIPISDYLFHAVKKIFMMGEFKLIPRPLLDPYLERLKEEVLRLCPEADREFLKLNLSRLTEAAPGVTSPVDVIFRQSGGPGSAVPGRRPEGAVSGDDSLNMRRFSVLLDRLEREIEGSRRAGTKPAKGAAAREALAVAARGSHNAQQLEQYLERLRAMGLDVGTADVFRSLGNQVPGFVPGAPADAGPTAPGASKTVEAMHRVVTQAEDPAEGSRRFHEMVKTAVERFNEGSLAQAVTMIELAERIVAEKKVDPVTAEVVRKKADEGLDTERLRRYAEFPDQHPLLRRLLNFFVALTPEGLLNDLRREPKRERRRLLLLLLEVHGAPARQVALERLNVAFAQGMGDEEWYYRRNLLYLLRRIPRSSSSSEQEDVDLAVRHASLQFPAPLVKEAIANLGQFKTEKSERTLTSLLADLENVLAKPADSPYDPREIRLLLDRVVAALARFGTGNAHRAVVEHALKKRPELGDTMTRAAELAGQDLSGNPDVVQRLLAAMKANTPFKLFGLVLHQNDQNLYSCIEALSTTPLPEVRDAFAEIVRRFPGQEVAKAASKALTNFGAPPAPPPEAAPASLTGDLELFGLPALLQSLSDSRTSGVLTLKSPSGEAFGGIVLRGGRLKSCQTGQLIGEEAFYQLLERPAPGSFQFAKQDTPATEDVSGLREILPLSLEGMRRYDEFQQAAALVPDDMTLKSASGKPTPHPDERDGILVKDLWTLVSRGAKPSECEGQLKADAYRIRRLLAHWVDTGALAAA